MFILSASAKGARCFFLPLLLVTLVLLAAPSHATRDGGKRFLVDYSPHPSPAAWVGFDEVILDPSAKVSLPAPQSGASAAGPEFFAYLSLVEIPQNASYAGEARSRGLVLKNLSNQTWNSSFADITNPAWEAFFIEQLAAPAVKKGFSGFFLDTADSIHRMPGAGDPKRLANYRRQVSTLLVSLRKAFPKQTIILNRGFDLVEDLPAKTIDGILMESVFQTYDHTARTYTTVAEHDTLALTAKILSFREKGLPVYVIDYVDPAGRDLAAATARRIEKLGATALVTTPDLRGTVLAPALPVARKLFVLYGADRNLTANDPKFVPDTSIARHFQAIAEWSGYEMRYHNASESRPADLSPEEFAGILWESDTTLTPSDEVWYADWLLKQRDQGQKILFAGAISIYHPEARKKLLEGLGIRGSGEVIRDIRGPKFTAKDEIFDFEATVHPKSLEYLDLQAPKGVTPLLQLRAADRYGRQVQFDAAFVADWGGAFFNPYWLFQPYSKDTLSYFDPFKMFGALWPSGTFPAPDVTTRDGLRLFWAHVDGDAFATLSVTKRDTTCAEVIRDRILKRYPLPTTISVIEAEIRSIQETQNPADSPRLVKIARDIFRLPHVEAASHAFSHPFIWSDKDIAQQDNYDRRHLHLKAKHRFDTADPRREIEGSVKYINENLLPPEKRVQILLWTGNCRPFPEALRLCREIGIEAMNGGFTIYSPRHPQLAAIAPRVTWWDDELQIYAANQNEFVYTDDWSGPTFGGFEQVIRSFEMLDSPRRMKPVNIYYHFYSAVFPGSLKALERIYDWSMEQPLHAVAASDAARITRDAVKTRVSRTGSNRWLIHNEGRLTTFRIPKSLGYPDLDASTNVTGFNDHLSERYIHTNGEPFAEIVLSPEPPQRLYLKSSAAGISFKTLARNHCAFRTTSWRPSQLVFGGVPAGSPFTLTFVKPGEAPVYRDLTADKDGLLVFTLPESAEASLAPAAATASR